MTQLPPWTSSGMFQPMHPPPLGEPPAPPQVVGPPHRGAWIAWIVILLTTAALIAHTAWQQHHSTLVSFDDRLQFELEGRYCIGCRRLVNGLGLGDGKNTDRLLEGISAKADTSWDQLALAVVLGEMKGWDAAVDQLNHASGALPRDGALRDSLGVLRTIYTRGPSAVSPADRQKLVERFGWFGRLALSFGQPDTDPLRARALAEAHRTAITMLSAVGAYLALLPVGLVLLALGILHNVRHPGTARFRPPPQRIGDTLVEGFAVYLAAMGLLFAATAMLPPDAGLAWNGLLVVPVAAAIAWVRLRGVAWKEMCDAVGFNAGQGLLVEMGTGLVTLIGALPLLSLAMLVTLYLIRISGATPSHPIERGIESTLAVKIFIVVLAVIFAPITEELMFRGLLLTHLRLRWRWLGSALLVSLLFASIHPQGWTLIPVLGTLAMVLAYLREQRGSLAASMTLHALNNLVVILMLFLWLS